MPKRSERHAAYLYAGKGIVAVAIILDARFCLAELYARQATPTFQAAPEVPGSTCTSRCVETLPSGGSGGSIGSVSNPFTSIVVAALDLALVLIATGQLVGALELDLLHHHLGRLDHATIRFRRTVSAGSGP